MHTKWLSWFGFLILRDMNLSVSILFCLGYDPRDLCEGREIRKDKRLPLKEELSSCFGQLELIPLRNSGRQ